MKCPKCDNELQAVEFEGVEVDRCNHCQGIWFDAGERDWLFGEDAADALDTGDPDVGKHNNQIVRYRCPRCNGGMLRKTDYRHSKIEYEECTSCRGSFFDAGEFTAMINDSKRALPKEK